MEPKKVFTGAPVAVSVLRLLAVLCWLVSVATLSDLAGSDAAGNACSQAFAAIELVVLWGLLIVITILAGVAGDMPRGAIVAAFFLVPGSGVAAMAALELLSRPQDPPHLLPLIIPAGAPLLILAFAFWALLPPVHAKIPAGLASGVAWGGVLLLCVAIIPMQQARNKALADFMAARAKHAEDFAKMRADASLWEWVSFLNTPDQRALPRRWRKSASSSAGKVKPKSCWNAAIFR